MKSIDVCKVDLSDVTQKVTRFILSNQNDIPLLIIFGSSQNLKNKILMTLEDHDFRFTLLGKTVKVTE